MPVPGTSGCWIFNVVSREKKKAISPCRFCGVKAFQHLHLIAVTFGLSVSHYSEFPKRLVMLYIPIPLSCIAPHLPFALQILSGRGIP